MEKFYVKIPRRRFVRTVRDIKKHPGDVGEVEGMLSTGEIEGPREISARVIIYEGPTLNKRYVSH